MRAGAEIDDPAAMGITSFWPLSRDQQLPGISTDPFASVARPAASSALQGSSHAAQPAAPSLESSRRRQLGMQALDEKLAAARGSAANVGLASVLQSSLTGERRPLSRPASAAADLSAPPPSNGIPADEP